MEHWISEDGTNVTQHWTFNQVPELYNGIPVFKMTSTAPDGSKSVQFLRLDTSSGHYGFSDPLAGMPVEERVYDTNQVLRKRIINDWKVKASSGPNEAAARDPRIRRSVSITFEPGSLNGLATLSESEYDETGSGDPEFFSHLNVKRTKAYHYAAVSITPDTSAPLSWNTIESWFPASKIASATQTDFLYEEDYKDRGLRGLGYRHLTLNPVSLDPNYPLSRTETTYDDAHPAASGTYSYSMLGYSTGNSMDCSSDPQNPKVCWQNPNGSTGNIDLTKRGLPTTTRVWHAETSSWIENHTQYDQFGNAVKVKDAIGNETTTEFSSVNKYAYPTKVITPAPHLTANPHGTTEPSWVETTFDFWTGLPLTVKDEFDQITQTEYDTSLRPKRVFGLNVTAPETQTDYGTPDPGTGQYVAGERFVKIRKQIDETNWDEATTRFDGLGRTVKTQAKDSQGDVYVDTVYDNMGRVSLVTNPYRNGDTIYWSKTRYDAAGRAVETYAPAISAEIELAATNNNANLTSLGITYFASSTVTNFVGTVVTTTDASKRKGRSITNALGQLIRVDEPISFGGTEEQDLGSLESPHQPTIYTFDIAGKMVQVQQGAQNRYFKHDSLGRLIRVKQPEQEPNAALAMSDPYNTTWQWTAGFSYDIVGNVLTATDANAVTITNTYDKASRVTTRSYSGEPAGQTTPAVSFFYDGREAGPQPPSPNFAKGKLTKVENTISQTRYTVFDNFGRLKEMEQRTPVGAETISTATPRVSKYTYSFAGALIEEEYPSGRVVKNAFETDGDLLSVTSKKAGSQVFTPYASNFSYTASGGISQMRLGNGKWETAKFNSRLQVEELGLGASATDAGVWKVNYAYGELDQDGNVITAKNTGNIAKQTLTIPGASFVQAFRYDPLYRLTEAKETAGATANQNWIQNWSYDPYGNRLTFTQNIPGNTAVTNPAIDPLTNRFTDLETFGYDKNGNVIKDIDAATSYVRDFIFNGDNKQKEVKLSGATIAKYFYDGEGRRVKKQLYSSGEPSEETVFVYSAGKLVAEYSTNLPQQPSISYTTTDHLGSPRVITNQLGQVISRRDFMPFGEELISAVGARIGNPEYSSVDNVRQKFTGYQKDNETRLDFAEARMYENRYGRFTAVDPLLASGKSANPQTFNRYSYTSNNPIVRVDPDGQDWVRVKHTRVTYGKTYTTYQPVWKERAYGADKWTKGVYQVRYGADRGKWVALDPYSANHEVVGTRGEAVSAYRGFQRQRDHDVVGGAAIAAAQTADGSLTPLIGKYQPAENMVRAALNSAGINPNESSAVFQTANRGTTAIIAAGSALGVESLVARAGTAGLRTIIANPVPARLARVIPGEGPFTTLGPPAKTDVFVTAADDIAGLNSAADVEAIDDSRK